MPKRKLQPNPETPKPLLVRTAAKTLTISAADFLPGHESLPSLRQASKGCRGCDLWKNATQTVFGEGNPGSTVMMVGEQPGDKEDRAGRPFVGPAGALLDRALEAAGIDRERVYVTNAVKHFKWMARGRKRIHKKPSTREIAACRPWLDAELRTVRPRIVVCLGSTAAQALLGKDFKVTQQRGELIEKDGILFTATVHPSSILRSPDDESRHAEMELFIRDLQRVAGILRERKAA
ncbi:MAG TPA: UdgX family uracil-DNA binding protein [Terriglobales bacterium]